MIMKKLFLASSSELKEDRKEFEIFISRKNNDLVSKGVFLELVVWEDFLDAVSNTRLQDEYNKAIRQCDFFLMLFCTKVGQYTEEEFETAFGHFKATNKPLIFTYFKDEGISTGSAKKEDLMSLWAFQEKLNALGHFYTVYKNIDELNLKFGQQLNKILAVPPLEDGIKVDATTFLYAQAAEFLSRWLARRRGDDSTPPRVLDAPEGVTVGEARPLADAPSEEAIEVLQELKDLAELIKDGKVDVESAAARATIADLRDVIEVALRAPVRLAGEAPRPVRVSDVSVVSERVAGRVAGLRADLAKLSGGADIKSIDVRTGDVHGDVAGVDLR